MPWVARENQKGRPRARRDQAAGRPASVLEQQLAVLRERPEVVRDQRLELVRDGPQGVLGGDHLVTERAGLVLHRARLVGAVLGVLERADRVHQPVGQAGHPLRDRRDAP